MIIEVIRTGRDGVRRNEILSSARTIPGQYIDDWFSAGRSVSR